MAGSTVGHNKPGNICINVSFRRVRGNHFRRAKARGITYSEFVSIALVIQHAKRMGRIMLSSMACLVLPYFSTLSHKQYVFRKKKVTEHKMYVLIVSTTFTCNVSHSEKNAGGYY